MPLRRLVILLLILAASSALAAAQGTYTQMDFPGSVLTWGTAINTAGDIVGFYQTSGIVYHGFVFRNGVYTTIDYPSSTLTVPYGINNLGQIVGEAADLNVGFIYDIATQTFTNLRVPYATVTVPYGINDSGQITGTFYSSPAWGTFILTGHGFQRLTPPGASSSVGVSIAADGLVVINATFNDKQATFTYGNHTYRGFLIDDNPAALVNSVSPQGAAMTGYYSNPANGNYVGFQYQNKVLTNLEFPGATSTLGGGVNDSGVVTGNFTDAAGATHGFIWTPPAK